VQSNELAPPATTDPNGWPADPTGTLTPFGMWPTLTINGTSTSQTLDILHTTYTFNSGTDGWRRDSGGIPIWDPKKPFGVSDNTYVLQGGPTLVNGNLVMKRDFDSNGGDSRAFARTAVGLIAGKRGPNLYIVVADGEGISGGNGASN